MNYSIIHVALAYAAGTLLGAKLPVSLPSEILYIPALVIAGLSILPDRRHRVLMRGLLIAVAFFGLLRAQSAKIPEPFLYRRAPYLKEVTGTIVSYPELAGDYTAFEFAPDHLLGKIRVTCFWNDTAPERLLYGDRLRLVGKTQVPERFADFDYRAYLARRGVSATMTIEGERGIEPIGSSGHPWMRWGDRLRQRFISHFHRILPSREAGLIASLLFAERAALDPALEAAFQRTGLMHLLAVSGLHLSVFLAGLWALLRWSGLRPALAYPLIGIFVLAALWVVGPRVSLVRAALLFAFIGLGSVLADLGVILRRWVEPLHGLAAAALVLLAVRPWALFDVGFQLSVAATGGILLILHRTSPVRGWMIDRTGSGIRGRILHYSMTLLTVSAAAQAGATPVLLHHFAAFHPYILLANLIAVPLVTGILWIALLALAFGSSPYSGCVVAPLRYALRLLIDFVERFSTIPGCQLAAPRWMGIWVGGLVGYAVAVAFIATRFPRAPENRYRPRRSPADRERTVGRAGATDSGRAGSGRPRR